MRVTEKIRLIGSIATEMADRYTIVQMKIFFKEFSVEFQFDQQSYSSYAEAVFDNIKDLTPKVLKKIADELDLSTEIILTEPPANWEEKDTVKAFISHTSKDKETAAKIREYLKPFNIDGFVAHEDIVPSKEWQVEIEKALKTMDFFISVHTEGFKESIWCQQEVGFAACRNVVIIPIKFKEDPTGFIGKIHAIVRGKKNAPQVIDAILDILREDKRTASMYNERIDPHYTEYHELPF
jgi:hypothetical protein